MSMVITRSPLIQIEMNGAGTAKRRSARLSHEGNGGGVDENGDGAQPNAKRSKANGAAGATTVTTKTQDGASSTSATAANGAGNAGVSATAAAAAAAGRRGKKRKQDYNEDDDGFSFARKTRPKKNEPAKAPPAQEPELEAAAPKAVPVKPAAATASTRTAPEPQPQQQPQPQPEVAVETTPRTTQKKQRRRLPTTPEHKASQKPVRRSKRLSDENGQAKLSSPHKPAHAASHARTDGSPSPDKARPVTIERKRKKAGDGGGVEEEKIMRIALPFADTPIIRRNKEMRKVSAEKDGGRRSSGSLRGRRASSLIDEGRGSALPHAEVSTAEFYKHISAELTEPRRMRCLLGWCGSRALPPKPDAPKDSTSESSVEFQALQAARVVQAELSEDLVSKGTLSDWFSRDEQQQQKPLVQLRKRPNPRNMANAAKAEELVRELERLKAEQAAWNSLLKSTETQAGVQLPSSGNTDGALSPLRQELLDTPQRKILQQLQAPAIVNGDDNTVEPAIADADVSNIQNRLKNVTETLEFSIDSFSAGVHQLSTAREVANKLAERTLGDAAQMLDGRERKRKEDSRSGGVAAPSVLENLKGLARILNQQRAPPLPSQTQSKGQIRR